MEYQKKQDITYQELGRAFHVLLQSNTRFLLDGKLTMVVACIIPVVGGNDQLRIAGRGNNTAVRDLETYFHKSTSLVTVKAGRTACGYYALGFGIYRVEHGLQIEDFKNQWKSLVTHLSVQQTVFAAIWRKYNITVNYNVKVNEDILKDIQQKLRHLYKIVVVRRPTQIPHYGLITKVFEGDSEASEIIYLEYVPGETMDDGHYNYIKTVGAYHGAKGYCTECCHTHSRVGAHFCSAICRSCGKGQCTQEEEVECEACKVMCRSATCLEVHQAKQCKKFKYCTACEARYAPVKGYEHVCDERYCTQCKMPYTSGHHHYLVPADKEKLREEDMKTKIIIAYDIEAAQVRETDKTARHEANLLIAHVICDNCWDFSSKKPIDCSACVQHEHVFRGSDCVKNFVDFLINVVSKRAGKTQPVDIYAHNAKNYDSRFVLRELLRRKLVDIDLIMQGSKITRMKASNLRFVDSCAHFQQKLSKLPKSFDFADKVVKGFFPHLLNDGRDWNHYPRELPAPHLFGVETMQEEDRKGFEKWYTERSLTGVPWVFEEEIVKYCRNDVEVLLTAVQVYRKQMAEITGMDPTTRKFTLPGVTHEVFAANMLKPQAIGITPISNYAGRKQSYQGKAWLDAIELFTVGHRLEREKALGPYYADAFDKATNTVYEYWGCLWHGCPCAYGELEERDLKGRKLVKADLLKQKYEKLKYYERRGFNIVEEKECVFTRQIYKPTNYEVENESLESCRRREYCINRIQFYKQLHNDNNRCNIRGSFFGGRTGNASLFYECSEEEELKYYDFTSLYPHVLSAEAYPVGHPVEVNGNIDGSGEAFQGVLDRKYFGFVSCTVAPPHRARFGILPMRHDGKLVFPLCYTCTTQGDTGDCPHEECDRALNQTWSTPEIYKALEHGYRLLKVHHVLHYEKKDDQMFKEYIRMWLKIKQEASGWPGEVEKVLDLAKTAHITGLQQEATFYQSGIRANCDTHQLRTVNFEKTIKTRLDKRRYIALLGYSVPIGFKLLGAPGAPVHGPPTSMIELTQLYFTDT
ncbi:hypothetical protein HDE_07694 [Halotydeus destructor]|nr:hypothetical protein HDE_07694 [Halotydeus destructor]